MLISIPESSKLTFPKKDTYSTNFYFSESIV
jgi:hypothetical protein